MVTLSAGSTANSMKYTPNQGYVGTDSFNYVATDNHGAVSSKATVSITINDKTNSVNYDDFEGGAYTLTDGQTSPNQKWVCRFTGFGTCRYSERLCYWQQFHVSFTKSVNIS